MEDQENSKKRKRVDGVGSSDVEVEPSQAGEAPKMAPVVPTKKPLDINALKAKMAETKRKMEEVKAAAQANQASNAPASSVPAHPTTSAPSHAQLPTLPTASSSAHARFLQEQQNKRLKEQKKNDMSAAKEEPKPFDPSFDPRLKRAAVERKARPLVFLEAGALTKKAEVQQQKIDKMVEAKQEANQSEDRSSAPARRPKPTFSEEVIVEWWDQPYLATKKDTSDNAMEVDGKKSDSDQFDPLSIKEEMISLLIHHPTLTSPAVNVAEPAPRPLMLTPDQERRLAKQKRLLEQETRKEEILLGIRPAEKGRVKISNMVKVFADAITDPTLVEKRAKAELAEREARHMARNEERKLTPEQRKAKEIEKRKEDTSASSSVAVFRILSLENSKNRFKIDREVQKNFLSGVAVYSTDFVVLAVEGGPKAIARFTKKMIQKVPWTQPLPPPMQNAKEPPTADGEEEEKDGKKKEKCFGKKINPEDNACHLVWKGEVIRRSFTDFRFTFPPQGARAYFQSLGVVHYYDSAKSFVPSDSVVI